MSTSSTGGKGQRTDGRVWSGDISKYAGHWLWICKFCMSCTLGADTSALDFLNDRVKRLVAVNVILRSRLAAYDIAENFPCSSEEPPLPGLGQKPIDDNAIFITNEVLAEL